MDINNKFHLMLFGLLLGVFSYLFIVTTSALFLPYVNMDNGWCLKYSDIPGHDHKNDPICEEFKNDYEQKKYDHNKMMVKKASYFRVGTILFNIVLASIIFYFIPIIRKKSIRIKALIYSSAFGLVVPIIVFLILTSLLPAPYKWFPSEFETIRNIRVEKLLESFRNEDDSNTIPTELKNKDLEIDFKNLAITFEYLYLADELINEIQNRQEQLNKEDIENLIHITNLIIKHGSSVSDYALYKVHEDLPDNYKNKFLLSIKKINKGLSNKNFDEYLSGATLYGEYLEWSKRNEDQFNFNPE